MGRLHTTGSIQDHPRYLLIIMLKLRLAIFKGFEPWRSSGVDSLRGTPSHELG
jgi:hypothetical protein